MALFSLGRVCLQYTECDGCRKIDFRTMKTNKAVTCVKQKHSSVIGH